MPEKSIDWFKPLTGKGTFGRAAAKGAAVTVGAQAAKLAIHLMSTVILARLLTPDDFGLFAMAATVITLLATFKDFGLTLTTIQRPIITAEQVSTLFWFNIALSVALAGLTVATVPLVAWFYDTPEITGLINIMALGFILAGASAQHEALLRRNLHFGTLAALELGGLTVGLAIGVAMAYAGGGWWSLAALRLSQLGATSLGTWLVCCWRPGRPGLAEGWQSLALFGAHVSGANFTSYIGRNADNILIGWYHGVTALGIYAKAYDLLLAPLAVLNAPMQGIMVPLLSRFTASVVRYRRAWLTVAIALNLLFVPIGVAMVVLAEPIVLTLLGHQWQSAVPVARWLGVAILYQGAASACGWLLISQQRSLEYLHWGFFGTALMLVAFAVGLPWGAAGVAAAYSLQGLFLRAPLQFWYVGRRGPVSMSVILRSFLPGIVAGVITAILCLWIHASQLSPIVSALLAAGAVMVGAGGTASVWPNLRQQWLEILRPTGIEPVAAKKPST